VGIGEGGLRKKIPPSAAMMANRSGKPLESILGRDIIHRGDGDIEIRVSNEDKGSYHDTKKNQDIF